jgi:hypothetical protein
MQRGQTHPAEPPRRTERPAVAARCPDVAGVAATGIAAGLGSLARSRIAPRPLSFVAMSKRYAWYFGIVLALVIAVIVYFLLPYWRQLNG